MGRLHESREAIRAFQEKRLSELMKESYDSLLRRPRRERLETPPELEGLELAVCRKEGELGGVEITVEAAQRRLLIFMEADATGFEMMPDGRVIPFDTSHDPED